MRGEEELKLQPLAWHLLELLLAEPHRMFSREELLSTLWPGISVTESSLNQLIRRVRSVLGDGVIETVQRQGYRLGVEVGELPAEEPQRPRVKSPPDRFFGRDSELEELRRALSQGARLVSLVGPGGVGKTRLATEFASSRPEAHRVDVSSARDADGVARAAADALGIDAQKQALELARQLGQEPLFLKLTNLASTLMQAGRQQEARVALEEALDRSGVRGNPLDRAHVQFILAGLERSEGRLAMALSLAEQALRVAYDQSDLPSLASFLIERGLILASQGEIVAAARDLEEARTTCASLGPDRLLRERLEALQSALDPR